MENAEDYYEENEKMITLEATDVPLPPIHGFETHYEQNWQIMKSLKKRILALRPPMIKQEEKIYHENGLCYLFAKIHQKLMKAMEGKPAMMEQEDIQYPFAEEVDNDAIFQHFKSLKIQGIDSMMMMIWEVMMMMILQTPIPRAHQRRRIKERERETLQKLHQQKKVKGRIS